MHIHNAVDTKIQTCKHTSRTNLLKLSPRISRGDRCSWAHHAVTVELTLLSCARCLRLWPLLLLLLCVLLSILLSILLFICVLLLVVINGFAVVVIVVVIVVVSVVSASATVSTASTSSCCASVVIAVAVVVVVVVAVVAGDGVVTAVPLRGERTVWSVLLHKLRVQQLLSAYVLFKPLVHLVQLAAVQDNAQDEAISTAQNRLNVQYKAASSD
jgi:hypothetical protein